MAERGQPPRRSPSVTFSEDGYQSDEAPPMFAPPVAQPRRERRVEVAPRKSSLKRVTEPASAAEVPEEEEEEEEEEEKEEASLFPSLAVVIPCH